MPFASATRAATSPAAGRPRGGDPAGPRSWSCGSAGGDACGAGRCSSWGYRVKGNVADLGVGAIAVAVRAASTASAWCGDLAAIGCVATADAAGVSSPGRRTAARAPAHRCPGAGSADASGAPSGGSPVSRSPDRPARAAGREPHGLQVAPESQSGRPDSNRGPRRPERRALPGCATPRGRSMTVAREPVAQARADGLVVADGQPGDEGLEGRLERAVLARRPSAPARRPRWPRSAARTSSTRSGCRSAKYAPME